MEYNVNEGKSFLREVDGVSYGRIAVKTHVITNADKLEEVLAQYLKPVLHAGDTVFISEKVVACTQNRAIPMEDIRPTFLARLLCKFVYKNPYGIGLSIPETMQCALDECGIMRILFAAFVSVIGKILGKRGWFYKVAGDKARGIDGPCDCTLPPYNNYVVLTPEAPETVAKKCADFLGVPTAIVDANDLGVDILGYSTTALDAQGTSTKLLAPCLSRELIAEIIRDNPLGQSKQQTPFGIIRVGELSSED
ncbi:MAG: coenzyme F420-0:L-glutamate ligase [Oscillospiraceae bacterium]|nr:coenzyme F420-0:L-glutamate ligase [Oscillospiraceae bacterium]